MFVSAFVVCTFLAYAVHERMVAPDGSVNGLSPTASGSPQVQVAPQAQPTQPPLTFNNQPPSNAPAAQPAAQQPAAPTATPVPPTATPVPPTAQNQGQYKNGTFTGSEADAFYGLVQVKAVIQNGKLANVQVVEYPSDRRTSQRINTIALPYLQQEAVQAQNANIDIISGATLTSEAFMQSLQAALSSARQGS